ncbi:O-antigen ligase family protein [Telluribacter sp.]|jgi:O-antigen ligase|uniref:O-antigen ligase family protein n=1 Tax=Telluribacter sp. TaxID=1978767 RepID=UPI002E11D729|nr:O-antigen ligase family protein [Telluribacter sp.]
MEIYRRKLISNKIKLSEYGLYISLFPIFGITQTDVTGFTTLEYTNPSFILRGVFNTIVCLYLIYYIAKEKNVNTLFSGGFGHFYFWYIIGGIISLLMHTPTNINSWIKSIEIITITSLALLSYKNLQSTIGLKSAVNKVFLISLNLFFIIVATAIMIGLFNMNLIYGTSEERGVRLGATFLHPNTLALGSVCIIIMSWMLKNQNFISKKKAGFIYILSITIIYFTKSASGVLVMIIAILLITLYQKNNFIRILFVTTILFFVVSFFLNNKIETIITEGGGTWIDRSLVYNKTVKGIKENLIWGVGVFEGEKQFFKNQNMFSNWLPSHPHNFILELLLARGFILSIPTVFLIFYCLVHALKEITYRKNINKVSFSIIFIVILFHGLIESSIAGPFKPFCHTYFIIATFLFLNKNKANDRKIIKVNYANNIN